MLRTRLRLLKLHRKRDKLLRQISQIKAESQRKNDPRIANEWWAACGGQLDEVTSDIDCVVTQDLLRRAQNLHLPTPDPRDSSKWARFESEPALNANGMTEVRAAIRMEERERREVVESWLKVLGGLIGILTGLVGALIGLVAIWKGK